MIPLFHMLSNPNCKYQSMVIMPEDYEGWKKWDDYISMGILYKDARLEMTKSGVPFSIHFELDNFITSQ